MLVEWHRMIEFVVGSTAYADLGNCAIFDFIFAGVDSVYSAMPRPFSMTLCILNNMLMASRVGRIHLYFIPVLIRIYTAMNSNLNRYKMN